MQLEENTWVKDTKKEQLQRQMENLERVVTWKLKEKSAYNGRHNWEQKVLLCDNKKFQLDLTNWRSC